VTFYILRRVAVGALLLLLMSFIFFILTVVTPGEPISSGENPRLHEDQIQRILHRRGLDLPWYQRYPAYLASLAHGDLGDSYQYNEPVTTLLAQRVPNSVLLLGTALGVSIAIGVPLGIFAATRQYSKLDITTSLISYVGISTPSFILGIYLLLIFGVYLRASPLHLSFPIFGMHASGDESIPDLIYHMVLPVASLAIQQIAYFSRFMRAGMLEVLHQDFIRTARAKGLAPERVNYKHALRNAIIPIITLTALQIPFLVSGAIITEYIFSWPGMGQLAFQAVVIRDYPTILGVLMLVAFLTVLANLVADVFYAVADPRIRY
jgi:peptide/nickel transport system permease protein